MDEEAPTKIKGAGHLACYELGPLEMIFQLVGLGLLVWIVIGLMMVLLGARKGVLLKGLAVYGVGSVATLLFFAATILVMCNDNQPLLAHALKVAGELAPLAAILAGLGAVAWSIGRLLRPHNLAA
ncbi:MAG: hypothetical protein JSR45_08345 [Proteobacteria bacterium]|nr:hypothetical protein [Pseudomonadota bacterium]